MKSHTNGDIYIACSVALLCQYMCLPSGTRGRRKRRREWLTTWTEGTGPTGRGREMKRCNCEEEKKCWMNRINRAFYQWEKQQRCNISPDLSQALPGAASYNSYTDNLGLRGINSTYC